MAQTIATLRQLPSRGRPIASGHHRLVVPGLPYSVIYRIEPARVVVLAVRHHKRRPARTRHLKSD